MKHLVLDTLNHAVIVSVQADPGEPLNKPECLLAMAMTVVQGGAAGLRLANPENIRLVKEYLPAIPVIGITKPPHPHADPENHVYITPSLWAAESVLQAGADIVAMDATLRPRPTGEALSDIVARCKERFPNALLMADIATQAEAEAAVQLGFDLVGTTLSGYTAETLPRAASKEPDFELLSTLARTLPVPVICEGRIWEPHHVTRAFELGATAVVIGSAITRPHLITQRFVQAVPRLQSHA
jgi:N-acylglucosamine-6-phosphate 2-epimerase